jgi:hypothetical protein
MTPPVRVLIVDDELAFQEAARAMIDATAGFEWIGGASSGEDGVELAERLRPDLQSGRLANRYRAADPRPATACGVSRQGSPQ